MDEQYIKSFWEKVDKSNDCWVWTAALTEKGYGVAWDGHRTQKAHRVAFYLTNGYWPESCVLHKCDNPPCVNPDHLWLGTRNDNNRDMYEKGRNRKGPLPKDKNYNHPRGTNHPGAILSPDIVRAIRADKEKFSYSQLAKKYNIGMTTAYKVVKGITWSHVE